MEPFWEVGDERPISEEVDYSENRIGDELKNMADSTSKFIRALNTSSTKRMTPAEKNLDEKFIDSLKRINTEILHACALLDDKNVIHSLILRNGKNRVIIILSLGLAWRLRLQPNRYINQQQLELSILGRNMVQTQNWNRTKAKY